MYITISFKDSISYLDITKSIQTLHDELDVALKAECWGVYFEKPLQFGERVVGIAQRGGARDSAQER